MLRNVRAMYHLIDNYIITLKKYRSLTRISGNLIAIINRWSKVDPIGETVKP